MELPVHKHLIIRTEVNNPPGKDKQEYIKDWFRTLVKDIDMKLLSGPYCEYVDIPGNEGLTCVCIIETSHIAMHVWDAQKPALIQLDVYTCGPFKPIVVMDKLKEFDPVSMHWKYLDRETDLKTVDIGIWRESSPWPNKDQLNNG
jgi:S-adenosylmethionine/arginine decarboxylase-like enzyme